MALTPFAVPEFGGLNLASDPEEVGATSAVDLLNVDLDDRGRVRTRDGYNNLTASAWSDRLESLSFFYKINGDKFILSNDDTRYIAFDEAGVLVASVAPPTALVTQVDYARFGGPSAEVVYVVSLDMGGAATTQKFNGTTWANAGGVSLGGLPPYLIEIQSTDNRLVGVFAASNYSRVGFSDPGVPETFTATSTVDLTPGDGEKINALVGWRELVFVFKESKFFVFTGNSTGSTGLPLFNYRPVAAGVGAVAIGAAVGTPRGVYFFDRRGIYLTTGDTPTLVSRAIDPIFRGGSNALFQGGELNHAARAKVRLVWHDERLYVAYPSGSSTFNDRMLVYDPETLTWVLWNIPVNGMTSFRIGDRAELVFTYATGLNHIGRISSAYTTDDGTAFVSRYQSGFYEPSPGAKTTTRWTKLWGSGAPTLQIYTDHYSGIDLLGRGGPVALGLSSTPQLGYHLKSYSGELFSHQLSSQSGVWSVNRLEHDIQFVFQPT